MRVEYFSSGDLVTMDRAARRNQRREAGIFRRQLRRSWSRKSKGPSAPPLAVTLALFGVQFLVSGYFICATMLSGFIFDSCSERDCNFPSDRARRMDCSRWDTCALRILRRVVRSELHSRPRNLGDPPCGNRSIPGRAGRLDRVAPMGFGPASRIALSYYPESSVRGSAYGRQLTMKAESAVEVGCAVWVGCAGLSS